MESNEERAPTSKDGAVDGIWTKVDATMRYPFSGPIKWILDMSGR